MDGNTAVSQNSMADSESNPTTSPAEDSRDNKTTIAGPPKGDQQAAFPPIKVIPAGKTDVYPDRVNKKRDLSPLASPYRSKTSRRTRSRSRTPARHKTRVNSRSRTRTRSRSRRRTRSRTPSRSPRHRKRYRSQSNSPRDKSLTH